VLRGAGVALALPFLESLAPRRAHALAAPTRRKFVAIYFPLGTASFWKPNGVGAGDAWTLSPILEPLTPLKDQVTVLGHVDQAAWPSQDVSFGNGLLTGSYLTCVQLQPGAPAPPALPKNGVSVDQRIAQALGVKSLQAGLATLDYYCDGSPCEFSRSISWSDATTPLFKVISPQSLFDQIVAGLPMMPAPTPTPNPRAEARKSVLDFVIGNAQSLEPKLSHSDRARMDQFLTTVRDLEVRVAMAPTPAMPASCTVGVRPTQVFRVNDVPADYDRDVHANLMVDLLVMALSCDAAHVASFMLDDARSDFVYSFLPQRHFTPAGSTATTSMVSGSPIGLENAGSANDGWATLNWWYVSKLARLCQQMAALPDADGGTLLDNSVVWFGSGQQGENGAGNLPVLYVGKGGGALKTNLSLDFASASQRLSNVYLTFLRNVFGLPDTQFGDSTGIIPDLVT
jgi:hypothetical protein